MTDTYETISYYYSVDKKWHVYWVRCSSQLLYDKMTQSVHILQYLRIKLFTFLLIRDWFCLPTIPIRCLLLQQISHFNILKTECFLKSYLRFETKTITEYLTSFVLSRIVKYIVVNFNSIWRTEISFCYIKNKYSLNSRFPTNVADYCTDIG